MTRKKRSKRVTKTNALAARKVHSQFNVIKKKIREVEKKADKYVQTHPERAIAIAVAVGIGVGAAITASIAAALNKKRKR